MSDSQIHIPESFIRLFLVPGQPVPRHRAAELAMRHEFCDDLAMSLMPRAQELQFQLGITEADVIDRMLESLMVLTAVDDSAEARLMLAEARWVVCHMAEQLGWLDHLTEDLKALAADQAAGKHPH